MWTLPLPRPEWRTWRPTPSCAGAAGAKPNHWRRHIRSLDRQHLGATHRASKCPLTGWWWPDCTAMSGHSIAVQTRPGLYCCECEWPLWRNKLLSGRDPDMLLRNVHWEYDNQRYTKYCKKNIDLSSLCNVNRKWGCCCASA